VPTYILSTTINDPIQYLKHVVLWAGNSHFNTT